MIWLNAQKRNVIKVPYLKIGENFELQDPFRNLAIEKPIDFWTSL
jgi:hypothetical protein